MNRILIVDDNPLERCFAQRLLQNRNHWLIETATHGREALEHLMEHPADIVLTDLVMPEMNGLELLKEIQQRIPHIPVVIMTSRGSEDLAVQALQNGAASYLCKSGMRERLDQVLGSVLRAASRQQTHAQLLSPLEQWDLSFALPNERHLLFAAIRLLQQAAQQSGILKESDLTRLGIAVEEALSNAMIHGNLEVKSKLRERDDNSYEQLIALRKRQLPYCSRLIHVSARLCGEQIEIVVRDEGPGFEWNSIPDPTDAENLCRPHGRGLCMIHQCVDKVSHNKTGNEITLIKRAPQLVETPPAVAHELVS